MKTYELKISETGRANLRDTPHLFNIIRETFPVLSDIREYLLERYGRIPNRRNRVYIDTESGQAQEVGFTYSYWNNDISHPGPAWFQTDWVEIYNVNKTPVTNHWLA